jgi:hypothetical protein
MNVSADQIKKAFEDFKANDNNMNYENVSSFENFFDNEIITLKIESKRNFMNISFITILNDSISKQKVFVNITSNKNETESIMNNSSLIVTLNNSSLIVTVNNSSIVIADENTITSNTTDVQAELMRRRMLLKELSNTSEKSKEILDEIDTKKEFTKKLSTRKKKLKLENLSTNFRKKLKKQALNKILSS